MAAYVAARAAAAGLYLALPDVPVIDLLIDPASELASPFHPAIHGRVDAWRDEGERMETRKTNAQAVLAQRARREFDRTGKPYAGVVESLVLEAAPMPVERYVRYGDETIIRKHRLIISGRYQRSTSRGSNPWLFRFETKLSEVDDEARKLRQQYYAYSVKACADNDGYAWKSINGNNAGDVLHAILDAMERDGRAMANDETLLTALDVVGAVSAWDSARREQMSLERQARAHAVKAAERLAEASTATGRLMGLVGAS